MRVEVPVVVLSPEDLAVRLAIVEKAARGPLPGHP